LEYKKTYGVAQEGMEEQEEAAQNYKNTKVLLGLGMGQTIILLHVLDGL